MRVVQIAPRIAPGAGIPGVAWELQREFEALGHSVEALTADVLLPGPRRMHRSTTLQLLALAGRVVALSFAGTRRARKYLSDRPDAVSICHSSVMAGDVFVNHVIPFAALRARGRTFWRVLRNPLHVFTLVRDGVRFRGRTHRAVVALTTDEADALRKMFGRVRPPVTVIPNGVDLDRFRPPDHDERRRSRDRLGLDDEDRVALFVGHELRWKGVPLLIEALTHAPTVMLLVVGGDSKTVPMMRKLAGERGVTERVLFAGVHTDLRLFLAASDMFVFPSSYESYGMVIAEALASGMPVIATRVGCAGDLVKDGETGFIVDPDPRQLADRMERIAATDIESWRTACRAAVEHLAWREIAHRYVRLLADAFSERDGASS